ncbi:4Fe-4S dicluster domain-containing protein, partial [candidate division CSSED10-310 bacterium]
KKGDHLMDRRQFLKMGAAASGLALAPNPLEKVYAAEVEQEFVGVLVDTTRCIGCRRCEQACAKANGLPIPNIKDESVLKTIRTTDTEAWTVVNRYHTGKGLVSVKRQCMHCNQPGCTTACLVNAMLKKKAGPVIWQASKCMGCRYCMVSCPFDVPKFEYHKAIPTIQKCNFCFERQRKGQIPACVEACPVDALMFSSRRNVVENAHSRIAAKPDQYYHHIYGETEVGGTGWLYLANVPFDQIGFKTDLGITPYPEYTKMFMYLDPVVFVLWTSLLMGLHYITRTNKNAADKNSEAKEH